jgi:very-short-patch-repair endonuclease
MRRFPLDLGMPPSPLAPADPTPSPPLSGEGREAPRAKRRPRDWRPSPRAKKLAPHLRRNATEAEKELWWHLRRKLPLKGTHFRRQVAIGPFVVDFCCHGRRLIVELDGGQHSQDDSLIRDERRDSYLRAHGYRVMRFWNAQVFTEIDVVIDTIAAALLDATPPPPAAGAGRRTPPDG